MRFTAVIRPDGRGGAAPSRVRRRDDHVRLQSRVAPRRAQTRVSVALLAALLALALAAAAHGSELARAELSIAGISLEVDSKQVTTGIDEGWFDRTGLLARVNVAAARTATMSSTYSAQTPASRAVDGDTAGIGEAANAMTASEKNPWLTIDLGVGQPVEHVVLWPRSDCCSSRLSRFWIFASDQPFGSTDIATTRAQAGVSSFYCENAIAAATVFRINRSARFLRLQLTGTDILQIAEIQAFAPSTLQPINMAGGAAASQSATNGSSSAERAVDGNVDGRAGGAAFSDTGSVANSWWQLDLGSVQPLSFVDLWNRTDCCQTSSFYVFVSDAPFASTDVAATIAQPGVSTLYSGASALNAYRFAVNRTGRFVRIQASGTAAISLAEVQVWSQQQLLVPLTVERVVRR